MRPSVTYSCRVCGAAVPSEWVEPDGDPLCEEHAEETEEERQRAEEGHRRIGSAPEWSPLVHGEDGGGYRDFLDGRPVSHGSLVELQAFETVMHQSGEWRKRLATGVLVNYETECLPDGARQVVLDLRAGGHVFRMKAEPWMRFRWPRTT